jgi:hypothetical protein
MIKHAHTKRREKVFLVRGIPHDKNARARIEAYIRAWNARHKRPGQHIGPVTQAGLRVLKALLWHFLNWKNGRCFPSAEAIGEVAQCHRDTVFEALRALEATGALEWSHWIDRRGHGSARKVVRRSNCYRFRDIGRQSENPPRPDSRIHLSSVPERPRTHSRGGSGENLALEAALGRLREAREAALGA